MPSKASARKRSAAEAAERAALFMEDLERMGIEDLERIALPTPDPDARSQLLETAWRAAAEAGREELLADAVEAAREYVLRAFAEHQYQPTMFGLNWGRSLGTAADRAAVVTAAEDRAAAAVLEDVLPADVHDELVAGWELLGGEPALPGRPSRTVVIVAAVLVFLLVLPVVVPVASLVGLPGAIVTLIAAVGLGVAFARTTGHGAPGD